MADIRDRILVAAGPIFAERGFRATTVREICAAANVNIASVNYYFGDKQQLYVETIRLARNRRAEDVPIPQRPLGTSPQTRLKDFVLTILSRMGAMTDPPWETRLMMREVVEPSAACSELVEDYFRPHFEMLLSILSEQTAAGTSETLIRKIGFSIIGQCLFYRVAHGVVTMLTPPAELDEHFGLESLADHISNIALSAIGAQAPIATQSSTHEFDQDSTNLSMKATDV